jgi:hypothetical protein
MKPNKSEMFNRSRRDAGPAFDNKSLNIHDLRSRQNLKKRTTILTPELSINTNNNASIATVNQGMGDGYITLAEYFGQNPSEFQFS